MSERIKELAEQAGIKESLVVQFKGDTRAYVVQNNELEKFAELIVRECLDQCIKVEDDDKLSNYEGGFRDGALLCYQEIKQHFGVEEE